MLFFEGKIFMLLIQNYAIKKEINRQSTCIGNRSGILLETDREFSGNSGIPSRLTTAYQNTPSLG